MLKGLKCKRIENTSQETAGKLTLISDEIDCNPRSLTKIKRIIHQEDLTVPNLYACNHITLNISVYSQNQ